MLTNATQQDNNFKIKLFTDTPYLFNNYKIIIDINIILCYNVFVNEGRKIKLLNKI